MGGRYRITAASQIEVDQIVSTRMACKPELMQTDAALSSLLAKPLQIEVIDGASPQLRLVSASNETLVFAGSLTREAQFGAPTVIFLEVAPEHVACNRARLSALDVCKSASSTSMKKGFPLENQENGGRFTKTSKVSGIPRVNPTYCGSNALTEHNRRLERWGPFTYSICRRIGIGQSTAATEDTSIAAQIR